MYQSGRLGDEPGAAVMLGGQVVWLPEESSVNGTIVVDGIIWPPDDVGIVRDPVTLQVEAGRITSIEGGAEARILQAWLDSLQDPTIFEPELYGTFRLVDAASRLAAQNILLAAEALGLGGCPLTSFSVEGVRTILELPDHLIPDYIVQLGHPAPERLSWRGWPNISPSGQRRSFRPELTRATTRPGRAVLAD